MPRLSVEGDKSVPTGVDISVEPLISEIRVIAGQPESGVEVGVDQLDIPGPILVDCPPQTAPLSDNA